MPELPEVETVARGLRARLRGRRIREVRAHFPGVLTVGEGCVEPAGGWWVESIGRRGKLLLVELEGGCCLSVHLRMTGHLSIEEPSAPLLPHTHVTALLDDGTQLRFVDPRRFGRLHLGRREDVHGTAFLRTLGPEPFDLDACALAERLAAHTASLKSVLLDQKVVAGIGNIYADEILFAAGLNPRQPANRLLPREIGALTEAMCDVLRAAIDAGGSTIRDYRMLDGRAGGHQEVHAVFGRAGLPCRRCGATLRRSELAGRGTHFCPVCQPLRRRRPRPRRHQGRSGDLGGGG
jgi:formamidopyrimidine-DNA glycosylase